MTDTKHTKGPWTLCLDARGVDWVIRDGDGVAFMGSQTYYPWQSENIADAYLHAAGPELLEAVKDAYEWMNNLPIPTDGCTAKMQALHNAIKKAEGKP